MFTFFDLQSKLSRLHDNVPPLSALEIKSIIENELGGSIDEYFSSIELANPIGSASVAQVHVGVWKKTGEKVIFFNKKKTQIKLVIVIAHI
jgi:predicted unusual protein kinase regulating ubiquinone biosynthesis (AarF/ABC1/UbiB family)